MSARVMHPALSTALAILVAFAAAAAVVGLGRAIVRRRLDAMQVVSPENRAAVDARAKGLTRALTLLAYGVAALASISFALARVGIAEPRFEPRLLSRWMLDHGINVVVIVIGATIVIRAASLFIEHLQYRLAHPHAPSDLERQRRARTLAGILTSLVTVSVWFVAVLMLLRELAIDVLPILTGAGIAGLAIGFGAQNLVRDLISGFFIILEDQVRVGDLARINAVTGTVEQINLRTIVLRDGEGAVQVFPNGTVTAVANLSKQFAYAVVDVGVSYGEDLDRAADTIREVGAAMQGDAAWAPLILQPIEVLGIESMTGARATIRSRIKTQPLDRGRVANELRRRLVTAFVGRGIKPYA